MKKRLAIFAVVMTLIAAVTAYGAEWVNIRGNISGSDGTPLCAMVLANGQYMFTCDSSLGEYNLTVPPDNNGEITLFGFCDGLAPFKRVLKPADAENYDVEMAAASSDSKNITAAYEMTAADNGWIKISGKVLSGETPLCAMVLANGQHMFSCGGNGEYELTVPLDANGEITFFAFCDGLQPYKEIIRGCDNNDYVSETVTLNGGEVSLPDIGSVTFPSEAFLKDQVVELSTSNDSDLNEVFEETALMFSVNSRLSYELRINTGEAQPLTDCQVTLEVPEDFRKNVPPDSEVRVFVQVSWDDGNEKIDNFEIFPERFSSEDLFVTVTLPPWSFAEKNNTDKTFEAVVTLGTTPTAPNTSERKRRSVEDTEHLTIPDDADYAEYDFDQFQNMKMKRTGSDPCQGASLTPPLDGTLIVSSPKGERIHPLTKVKSMHDGVDYRVDVGTPVKAMADATIRKIYVQVGKDNYGKTIITGYGQYIILKHTDGSTSLYAHLSLNSAKFKQGDKVNAGDIIALSGNTGLGTGPHLHVEYAPNGKHFEKDSRVDPTPCINPEVNGSVILRDNGKLADDAFSLSLNGNKICQTGIGGASSCAIGNLRKGIIAQLTVTAVIAPDDIGTYELTLANGLTFGDGSTAYSGELSQGNSDTYIITVP